MKALIIAEHADVARELAGGARDLGADTVTAVCLGEEAECACDTMLKIEVPEGSLIDDAYLSLLPFAEDSEMVLVEATRRCKAIAGHLAAKLGTAAASATVGLSAEGARGTYFGGLAERVQKPVSNTAVYLVASGVCDPASARGIGSMQEVSWVAPRCGGAVISSKKREKVAADPTKADVVVAAGRGFTEEGQLDLARQLARKLSGTLACSRPLTEGVDWLPTELYVGVSGITVAPRLYIAAGISGQMQHMVGCNRSGCVIAINKDKNASVFRQCDFGIVGDVNEVIPALIAAL